MTIIWNIIFTISNRTRIEFEKNSIFDILKQWNIYWMNNSMFCVWIYNFRKFRNDVVFERIEKKRNWFCFFSWSRIDRKTTMLNFQRFFWCQNNDFSKFKQIDVFEWSTFTIVENASNSRIFDSQNAKLSNACHKNWLIENDRKKKSEIWIISLLNCFFLIFRFIYLRNIDENCCFIVIYWFNQHTFHKFDCNTIHK